MAESPKLKRLREMREKLVAGKYDQRALMLYCIQDTDGALYQLRDPKALEALDRRIAAEEAKDGPDA